jgi:hypothetical protein
VNHVVPAQAGTQFSVPITGLSDEHPLKHRAHLDCRLRGNDGVMATLRLSAVSFDLRTVRVTSGMQSPRVEAPVRADQFWETASSSVVSLGGAPGIVYFSSAQAPRSICLQRSEQKGRNVFASVHSTFLPQVGQETTVMMKLY